MTRSVGTGDTISMNQQFDEGEGHVQMSSPGAADVSGGGWAEIERDAALPLRLTLLSRVASGRNQGTRREFVVPK
jgi:hypothetical protein